MIASSHVVQFDIEPAERLSRGLALVKWLLVVPHWLVLYALWLAQLAVSLVAAVAIVFTGKYPLALFNFSIGTMRWLVNALAYSLSFRDEYPPFGWTPGIYPATFDLQYPASLSRIAVLLKLVGWVLYTIFLIYVMTWLWLAPWLVGFVGVMIYGRYPTRGRSLVLGATRLHLQLYCYLTFLTDQYNPFGSQEQPVTVVTAATQSTSTGRTVVKGTAPAPVGAQTPAVPETEIPFDVRPPNALPKFSSVGGMDKLKNELEETVGLLLAFPEKAVAYGIRWNGILLHGPPGTGKSFIAQATAGEFGLNYISVGAGELLSAFRGRSAQRVVEAFEAARKNLPCLLFFDEFDSVAAKRTSQPSAEERNTVNQLLRSLEKYREFPDLIVMAATNDIDHLDTAAVRPGRFDRKIRVDLPDGKAREAVLSVLLAKRPTRDVNVAGLASTLEGLSVAAIRQVVEAAALKAMQTEASGGDGAITGELLITTAKSGGGHDKPLAQDWNWDDLVLQEETKDELFQVQRFVENADLALEYGVEPPTGILLYGPPGTGKTTIAKVLAAQAHASFYAISPADLISKWVGETEENIAQVFSRARENRPSIVFIDEIDALFPKRGATRSFDDRWTNQLLQEIDGIKSQRGVFVVGATNRRDMLDDALLRGGRLSRQIAIPPPDRECRRKLLELASARMPLVGVNLDKLADEAEGFSGADLKALAQDAAVKAAMRSTKDSSRVKAITSSDFDAALADFKEQKERV